MKRLLGAAFSLVFLSGMAIAQEDYPKVELFSGYSVLKLGLSEDFNRMLDFPVTTHHSKTLSQGFNVSVSDNLMENLGIVVDFRYNQGDVIKMEGTAPASIVKMKSLSAMAGPRYTLRKNEIFTPFLHLLAGLDYWRLVTNFEVMGVPMDAAINDIGVGVAAGGGIDMKIHERVAVRLFQADYYVTRHADRKINNFNLAFGIVFRLGSK
jgi:opacity protein-like surface antigen